MKHYDEAFHTYMKLYEKEMQDHVLKKVSENIWYIGRPGTTIYCAFIAFFGDSIGITGDIVIQGNGVFSTVGYSKDWFVGELHADYLGTKFLVRGWVEECAMDFVDDGIVEMENVEADDPGEETAYKMRDALAFIRAHKLWDQYEFAKIWGDVAEDRWPRMWYRPEALAMLSTVQKTFARLYKETP